jgi:hypothetical protein
VVRRILELKQQHPSRVHYVLGNHDYGHIGGPHTSKFYDDEVAHLEAVLDEEGQANLRELFAPALLAVVAPCGALLTHGAPGEVLSSFRKLDDLQLPANGADSDLVDSLLNSYGQPGEVMGRVLGRLSEQLGFPLTLAIHGHDRDESGLYVEGGNQVCPVLFGAPRDSKRYLVLDLAAHYQSASDLVGGAEIQTLYGAEDLRRYPSA